MKQAKTGFVANDHGFRFVNSFRLPSMDTVPILGSLKLNELIYGLCGGMCFAALDFYHKDLQVPETRKVKEIDKKLFVYLWDRQLDSLKIPTVIKMVDWMFKEDKDLHLRMARYEIPKIQRSLERGQPTVLLLIRVKELGGVTQNHQVLATGYELDPETKEMKIFLYDPNYPGKDPHISLSLKKPSQGLNLKQSTNDSLRAFFVNSYKTQRFTPSALAAQEPAMRDLGSSAALTEPEIRLRWPVDSLRVTQSFGENPSFYKPFGLPGHEGIDFFAASGANVYAAAQGIVYQVGFPANHPYGNHVRIKHEDGGKVYKTIYAHLDKALVHVDQVVEAGQIIGLADNTGNSLGAHLHFSLKIEGEQAEGYPAGFVDPRPYLYSPHIPVQPGHPPDASGLTVYTTEPLNLRTGANTGFPVLGVLPAGEAITALGDEESLRKKVGKQDEWLHVQTASGQTGFVAAWFTCLIEEALPPSDLIVYPVDALNLRTGPATAFNALTVLDVGEPLSVLGDADNARAKVGQHGEWLQVQTSSGLRGYVAARYVRVTGKSPPPTGIVVFAKTSLDLRSLPDRDAHRLSTVKSTEPLTVLGIQSVALRKLGVQGEWISVRTRSKHTGFVPAWLVERKGETSPHFG